MQICMFSLLARFLQWELQDPSQPGASCHLKIVALHSHTIYLSPGSFKMMLGEGFQGIPVSSTLGIIGLVSQAGGWGLGKRGRVLILSPWGLQPQGCQCTMN